MKPSHKHHTAQIDTTIGDLVASIYETALKEAGDDKLARRIASQLVTRKFRYFRRHLDHFDFHH